jgi:hypothetical protein
MVEANVNLWAVLLAGIASIVVGSLWYSQLLFGKQWMALMKVKMPSKKEMSAMKGKMMGGYVAQFIASLVTFYVLGTFMDYAGVTTIAGALQVALCAWIGFVATYSLGSVLWEQKPFKLWVLNNAYNLLMLLIGATILITVG